VPKTPGALLAVLLGCIVYGIVNRDLLTKIPESLMNAGSLDLPSGMPWSESDACIRWKKLGDIQDLEPGTFGLHQIRLSKVDAMLVDNAAELKEFKCQASVALESFFATSDVEEVERWLKKLGQKQYQHEFVKKAIVMSFSQRVQDRARESVLALFQHLATAGKLSKDDLQWGITRLLSQLTDIELDCPRAAELTIEFLICMVVEELVSIPFLRHCRTLRIGGATGLQVIDAAQKRIPESSKKELGTVEFKREINTMILEYFNCWDQQEFARCVRDLAPLSDERGAELVRKIMHLAMERSGNECEQVLGLLVFLRRDNEITASIFELGFNALYKVMPDIILDVPDAQEMAQAFVVEAKKAGVLPESWTIPDTS